ncbi:antibiotic biosynthesis monooxygenase [Rhodococcus olei]|uniref:Antibiotic biosynthesis monooxygenase n=1 Tax=Rhodococcus olei TaxID=2161675 RepID=A0ABP8PK88_9NOCA
MTATAVTVFHRTADRDVFLRWAVDTVGSAAREFPGFREVRAAAPEAPSLDWAASVAFDTEQHLHAWLDSATGALVGSSGETMGLRRASPPLILLPGRLPPGTVVFEHPVAPGREANFEDAQARLAATISAYPGFEGSAVLGPQTAGSWIAVLRFRTEHHLEDWMRSAQRAEALPDLRSQLAGDFTVAVRSVPFGSVLRVQDGETRVTPTWKTAMLVLLVLYPTVMTLSRFVTPRVADLGAPPWLSIWIGQIGSVALLSWLLMPTITRRFRRWLDPVEGAGRRVGVVGAAVVALGYAATLAVFATVPWLQFWTHQP